MLLVNIRSARLVTIEGLVQTAEGDPAKDAVIVLSTPDGPRSTIAETGRFTLAGIDPRRFPQHRAALEAKWKNTSVRMEVDLRVNIGPLVLRLPAVDLPLRVTFRELKRGDAATLAEGKLSPAMAEKLGGQPFIVANETFELVRKLFKDGYQWAFGFEDISRREVARIAGDTGWKLLGREYGPVFWKSAGKRELERLSSPERSTPLQEI